MRNTYPSRLSTDELRRELDVYLAARRQQGKAADTLDLDRRKVEYFLNWLDTGSLPGESHGHL